MGESMKLYLEKRDFCLEEEEEEAKARAEHVNIVIQLNKSLN